MFVPKELNQLLKLAGVKHGTIAIPGVEEFVVFSVEQVHDAMIDLAAQDVDVSCLANDIAAMREYGVCEMSAKVYQKVSEVELSADFVAKYSFAPADRRVLNLPHGHVVDLGHHGAKLGDTIWSVERGFDFLLTAEGVDPFQRVHVLKGMFTAGLAIDEVAFSDSFNLLHPDERRRYERSIRRSLFRAALAWVFTRRVVVSHVIVIRVVKL